MTTQSMEALGSDVRNVIVVCFPSSSNSYNCFYMIGSLIVDMDCHLVIGVAVKSAT